MINYTCKECEGTTIGSNICENPDCPNMPCCGKAKEECCSIKDTMNLERSKRVCGCLNDHPEWEENTKKVFEAY